MSVSLLLRCSTVFVLVTFSTGMNCWSSSLISPNTVFNICQAIWCSLVSNPATLYVVKLLVVWQVITHHNPGGIHEKLGLAWTNFQLVETWWIVSECQSCPYTTFSGGQFCSFSSIRMPEPFKHIGGYIPLYISVSGHQIILKSLQFTNQVRMDNSIICLNLPTIAILIHSIGTSIYSSVAMEPWSTPTVLSSASWPSAVLKWEHPKHLGSYVKTTILQ